jgi:hypothetical protein
MRKRKGVRCSSGREHEEEEREVRGNSMGFHGELGACKSGGG